MKLFRNEGTPEVYILSAFSQYNGDKDNRDAHYEMGCELRNKDVPHKEVFGRYHGREERAYVVPGVFIDEVRELAIAYEQEIVLRVSDERVAYAVDPHTMYDGGYCMGDFVPVSSVERDEDYTYCPYLNQYFVVVA